MTVPVWCNALELDTGAFSGQWKDRRWMNTPGPFYTGDSDFALVGPTTAPRLIGPDDRCVDVVYRPPWTELEVAQIRQAAENDSFGGYAADGNEHWTPELAREWWRQVGEIRSFVVSKLLGAACWLHASDSELVSRIGVEWLHFLDHEAHFYLRCYCYFLSEGTWPTPDVRLPAI